MIGVGVLINLFSGNNNAAILQNAIGKTIASIRLLHNEGHDEKELCLTFTDGSILIAWDDGQSCCEHRYMTCDDNLEEFAGSTLIGMAIANGPTSHDRYGEPHEIQFLNVHTSLGVITVETHNEHNGYYSGFYIRLRTVQRIE